MITTSLEHKVSELSDYNLFEEVGKGAFGKVFRASHKGSQKEVALKVCT